MAVGLWVPGRELAQGMETVVGVVVRLWVPGREPARGMETADGAVFSVMVFNAETLTEMWSVSASCVCHVAGLGGMSKYSVNAAGPLSFLLLRKQ